MSNEKTISSLMQHATQCSYTASDTQNVLTGWKRSYEQSSDDITDDDDLLGFVSVNGKPLPGAYLTEDGSISRIADVSDLPDDQIVQLRKNYVRRVLIPSVSSKLCGALASTTASV